MDHENDTVQSVNEEPSSRDAQKLSNSTSNASLPKKDSIWHQFKNWIITDPSAHCVENPKYNYQAYNFPNYYYLLGGRFRAVKAFNRQNSPQGKKSDPMALIIFVILGLILLPITLYFIFEAKWCWNNISPAAVVIFAYFCLLLLQNFFYCAFTDPGILPRNVHLVDNLTTDGLPQEYYNIMTLPGPIKKNGVHTSVDVKYCSTCNIWRPSRSFHCSKCNACILSHDHHCLWLNSCIGQRTYFYFISFVIFTVTCCCMIIGMSFYRIQEESFKSKNSAGLDVSLFLGIYCILGILFPLLLLMAHIAVGLVGINSREFLNLEKDTDNDGSTSPMRLVRYIQYVSSKSLFNQESMYSNIKMQWFRNRGVSNIAMRQRYVTGDTRFRSYQFGVGET